MLSLDGFTTRDLIYSWNDEFAAYTGDKENAQFLLQTFRYLNGTRTYATGEASFINVCWLCYCVSMDFKGQ